VAALILGKAVLLADMLPTKTAWCEPIPTPVARHLRRAPVTDSTVTIHSKGASL